jgi:hypothetical protein
LTLSNARRTPLRGAANNLRDGDAIIGDASDNSWRYTDSGAPRGMRFDASPIPENYDLRLAAQAVNL